MLTQRENESLRACNECATACLQCAYACLKEEDPKAMLVCITFDLECADICRFAAASIARGDKHVKSVCALCIEICQSCATECSEHAMDHCQRCAIACKHCVDACRSMLH